jgi:hypothetical protein
MAKMDGPPRYRSYVLTCWAEQGHDQKWRFSLTDPRTGQRYGFASLEALVAALEWEMADMWAENRKNEKSTNTIKERST